MVNAWPNSLNRLNWSNHGYWNEHNAFIAYQARGLLMN